MTHVIAGAAVNNANDTERLSDVQIIEALKDTSKVWDELFPMEQARIARMFIKQVILKEDGLDIQIYNEGLNLEAVARDPDFLSNTKIYFL
ncbi:MAG: hypothetical protein AABY27_02170, partial [Pseudomonadota bacterium]